MEMTLDAQGWVCPKPVIEAKKTLDGFDECTLTVLVDNEIASENLRRLSQSLGCGYDRVKESDKLYRVTLTKEACSQCQPMTMEGSLVIVITSQYFGNGSDELGASLMKGYLAALAEADKKPESLIFINGGVHLTTEGSQVLDSLKALEEAGVEVMSCGACLNFYGLADKVKVGSVSNMYAFVEKMNAASNTIRL